MNVLLEYLYRDAGNNKIWGDVVFLNRRNLDVSALDADIKSALIDGEFFVAENVGLPPLCFESHDEKLDHEWHEYFSIKESRFGPNESTNRDICDFILSLSKSDGEYLQR